MNITEKQKTAITDFVEKLKQAEKSGNLGIDSELYQLIHIFNWVYYLNRLSTPYIELQKTNDGMGIWKLHPAMSSLISFGYDEIMEEPFLGIRKDIYMEYFKDSKMIALGVTRDNKYICFRFFKGKDISLVILAPVVSERLEIFKEHMKKFNIENGHHENNNGLWKIYIRPFEGDDVVPGKALDVVYLDPKNHPTDIPKFKGVFTN